MITRVIFNQKGGVGKSSIAVNLASISATRGHRTLLIDLDPQCNATQYLLGENYGIPDEFSTDQGLPNEQSPTSKNAHKDIATFFNQLLQPNSPSPALLFALPFGATASETTELSACIRPTPFENLSLIASSPVLGEILHQLESKHKILKLKEALASLGDTFDRVYIDTPPAFNFFTLSALIASDCVIVPFDCDVFSKRALQTLVANVVETREDHNPNLYIQGIVVNQFDARANLPTQVVQSLLDEGYPVFSAKLSPSVLMKESHHANLPLIYLNAKHKLTEQFVALYQEIES